MRLNNSENIFPYFFIVWVVFGLGSSAFFFLNKNASLKRRLWPIVSIAASIVFVGFIWAMGILGKELFFVIPMIVAMTFLNLRAMKFCNSCGRTLMNQNPFSPPKFCSKCGANLEADA